MPQLLLVRTSGSSADRTTRYWPIMGGDGVISARVIEHLLDDATRAPGPLCASILHTRSSEAEALLGRSSFMRADDELLVDCKRWRDVSNAPVRTDHTQEHPPGSLVELGHMSTCTPRTPSSKLAAEPLRDPGIELTEMFSLELSEPESQPFGVSNEGVEVTPEIGSRQFGAPGVARLS
jgi:hypothetical protein